MCPSLARIERKLFVQTERRMSAIASRVEQYEADVPNVSLISPDFGS
jgi:hypothetical protein